MSNRDRVIDDAVKASEELEKAIKKYIQEHEKPVTYEELMKFGLTEFEAIAWLENEEDNK